MRMNGNTRRTGPALEALQQFILWPVNERGMLW